MENLFAFYDQTGRIVMRSTVHPIRDERKLRPEEEYLRIPSPPLDVLARQAADSFMPGLNFVQVDFATSSDRFYIDVETKKPVELPPQPSQHHEWNWNTKTWIIKSSVVDDIWQRIARERDRRSLEGGVFVKDTWFHTDIISRAKYTNFILTDAVPVEWKAMGGVYGAMTTGLAKQILRTIASNDAAIFNAAQAHRAALEADTNPERYDWYGGWPATYQEATA